MVSSDPTEQKSLETCSQGMPPMMGLHSSVMKWMMGSMYFSNMGLSSADSCLRRLSSQDATSGFQPSSVSET